VRSDWCDTLLQEREGPSFDRLILHRDTGMLAHVLGPRDHNEGSQLAVGIHQVAKEVPADGALPAAEDSHFVHRRQEITGPLVGNPVFDRDQQRPILRIRSDRQRGISPVKRGRQVEALDLVQRPAPGRRVGTPVLTRRPKARFRCRSVPPTRPTRSCPRPSCLGTPATRRPELALAPRSE
jgi:hypothetical protein